LDMSYINKPKKVRKTPAKIPARKFK